MGTLAFYLASSSRKLHENERNWTRRGGVSLRSANEFVEITDKLFSFVELNSLFSTSTCTNTLLFAFTRAKQWIDGSLVNLICDRLFSSVFANIRLDLIVARRQLCRHNFQHYQPIDDVQLDDDKESIWHRQIWSNGRQWNQNKVGS